MSRFLASSNTAGKIVHSPVLGVTSLHRLKVDVTIAAWVELTDELVPVVLGCTSACWTVLFCISWRMGTTTICSSPVRDVGIGLLSWIKNNIFVFSTTAGVPGGAISGPLGGILRHHSTRHLSLLGSWFNSNFIILMQSRSILGGAPRRRAKAVMALPL